jgi:hypothetical protein
MSVCRVGGGESGHPDYGMPCVVLIDTGNCCQCGKEVALPASLEFGCITEGWIAPVKKG